VLTAPHVRSREGLNLTQFCMGYGGQLVYPRIGSVARGRASIVVVRLTQNPRRDIRSTRGLSHGSYRNNLFVFFAAFYLI
jgi:hypothetical protein